MDRDTAEIVFWLLMGLAFLVWAADLVMVLLIAPRREEGGRQFQAMGDWDPDGEVVVDGPPDAVGRAILRALRQSALGMVGAGYRAVEQTDRLLRVEKIGALVCNQPLGLYFDRAEFRLERAGEGRTRVAYVLSDDRIRRLFYRIGLGLVLGLALPALIAICVVIDQFVIRDEDPNVRWQVLQSLQAIHFLWPPLLVLLPVWLAPGQSRVFVENLLATLDEA